MRGTRGVGTKIGESLVAQAAEQAVFISALHVHPNTGQIDAVPPRARGNDTFTETKISARIDAVGSGTENIDFVVRSGIVEYEKRMIGGTLQREIEPTVLGRQHRCRYLLLDYRGRARCRIGSRGALPETHIQPHHPQHGEGHSPGRHTVPRLCALHSSRINAAQRPEHARSEGRAPELVHAVRRSSAHIKKVRKRPSTAKGPIP